MSAAPRWVAVEPSDDGLRTLTVDRPPVNALGRELVGELEDALDALAADRRARCLVLRTGGRHFCAGADLNERRDMSDAEVREFVPRLGRLAGRVAALPFPTIAALRGSAVGGGCELALACDLRVMAEGATIGLRETALAILPGAGGTQRLPRVIGVARAKRWIFTARMHSAAEALADGAVDRVVPDGELDAAARELAREIAANGPVAVRLAKRAIEAGAELPLAEALDLEWECYGGTLATADRVEALRAFADKRAPRFRGE